MHAVQVSHFSNNCQDIFMRLIFTAYPHMYLICFICTSSYLYAILQVPSNFVKRKYKDIKIVLYMYNINKFYLLYDNTPIIVMKQ